MRVGVYIDAFNLYYGGRSVCGGSVPGWRWLDVRELVRPYAGWSNATIERVVYCTARVNAADSQSASTDQSIYLRALKHSGCIDVLEEGSYVSWAKEAPLVSDPSGTPAPQLVMADGTERWTKSLPMRVTPDHHILATVRKREEKGSDVNVATHLLRDVLSGAVDAAIVISNDSDLALPLKIARGSVPVGTINPSTNYLAGALRGKASQGPGRHWWKQLSASDYRRSQLPDPVGKFRKPAGW
jgi:hypothetical protein